MTTYDAIMVGGGVVGASTAWHLVREGARTLLVDRGDPGRASDAGAGILSTVTGIDHPDPVHRFAARAAQHYPKLIEQLHAEGAGDTGYAVCGALTVAVAEEEVAELELARSTGAGFDGPVAITPEQARQRFPSLADVRAALHDPRRARVDGGC